MDRTKFLSLAEKMNENFLEAKRLDVLMKESWNSDTAEKIFLRADRLCRKISELSEETAKLADAEDK